MRKLALIAIILVSVALIVFFGWYFLIKDADTPLGEVINDALPFGSSDDIPGQTTDNLQPTTGEREQATFDEFGSPAVKLFRISNTPVAGAVVFERGGQVTVRYVDRATGHIYDADLATLEKTKVTNQTLPKIYEAYFRPDGNAVLFRSLAEDSDVIENLSLTLTPPLATSSDALYSVSSTALRGDIDAVAVGSGNVLFYSLQDASSIVSSAFNGTGTKTILSSPFKSWRLVSAGNTLLVHTKASTNIGGLAYLLNTSSGALKKVAGPFKGLVATPNSSGNRIIYSYIDGKEAKTFVKNVQTDISSEIQAPTIAEKCVWGVANTAVVLCGIPAGGVGTNEPDNWYRGVTHFSDRIWLFDTGADIYQVLAEPKQSLDVDIDVTEPKLSPDEDYLVFINRNDLSLWALRLE